MVGVDGTVLLLEIYNSTHKSFIGNCFPDNDGFPELPCVIFNRMFFMDDVIWSKVVKVFTQHISKILVIVVSFVLYFILYILIL